MRLPHTDWQLWLCISIYFYLRAELHTYDTPWIRQCVVRGQCLHAKFSHRGNEHWCTAHRHMTNCRRNLHKSCFYDMEISLPYFLSFFFFFWGKRCISMKNFSSVFAHTHGWNLILSWKSHDWQSNYNFLKNLVCLGELLHGTVVLSYFNWLYNQYHLFHSNWLWGTLKQLVSCPK